VEDAIQLGRMLIEAKGTLPHGKSTEMVAHKLTFGPRTAQMLMAIAADERFQNPNHASLFQTATWRPSMNCTKLPDAVLEKARKMGKIYPGMTRREAMMLSDVSSTEQVVEVRAYVEPEETPAERNGHRTPTYTLRSMPTAERQASMTVLEHQPTDQELRLAKLQEARRDAEEFVARYEGEAFCELIAPVLEAINAEVARLDDE